MVSRTYQNFDLLVEAEADDVFQVRVTSCPLEESPSARFRLPWEPTQLENLLLRLDPGRSGTRRVAGDPQMQASMDLGGPLFESVFPEDIMLTWSRSIDAAQAAGDGLRLRLRLGDAPTLAGLPWELLYDRRNNAFIAQSEKTPVVRYLDVRQPPRPLVVDGALRILMVISSPTDLPELDVEAEWTKVHDALGPKIDQGVVVLDRLPAATIPDLATWLRRHDVHVLHFVGHGDYDRRVQDGVLFFTDRYGRSTPVTPSILGPHVHDHDPLRLVVLNACQSARADTIDPFSGMAQGLVQQDATAVVAMQFPISDGAAVTFTGEFYGSLADGLPVDQAVTSARKALLSGYQAEWATPVLFLRSRDGQVFEHIVASATPVEAAPAPPAAEAAPAPPAVEAQPQVFHTEPLPVQSPPPATAPTQVITRQPAPAASSWQQARQTYAETPPPPTWSPTQEPRPAPSQPSPSQPSPRQPGPPQPAPPPRRKSSALKWVIGSLVVIVGLVTALGLYGLHLENGDGSGGDGLRTGTALEAAHTSTRPTIDGSSSDWAGVPAYSSDVVVAPAGATGTVWGRWSLQWDEQALYLLVLVTDPAITQTHAAQPSQLFQGDGVSFEFGPPDVTTTSTLQSTDLHVLMGPTEDGGAVGGINVARGAVFAAGSAIDGAAGAVGALDGGYAIEAAIPWKLLRVTSVAVGQAFAMNLNVSDAVADGPARGSLRDMVSNNVKRTSNNAVTRADWGRLVLTG